MQEAVNLRTLVTPGVCILCVLIVLSVGFYWYLHTLNFLSAQLLTFTCFPLP